MPNQKTSLSVKTRDKGETVTFSPTGELTNGQTTGKLHNAIVDKIVSGATRIEVDFTNVTAIDSALVTVLLKAIQKLRLNGNGGGLKLIGVDNKFVDFFRQIGYGATFNIN